MRPSKLIPPDSGDSINLDRKLENFDFDTHESLEEGLIELRREYDKQDDRRNSIDTKTAGIIGLNGVVLSLIQDISVSGVEYLALGASTSLLLTSLIFAIWNLWPKNYLVPLATKEIPSYSRGKEREFQQRLYKAYFSSSVFNSKLNDVRYRWLLLSIGSLAGGILFLAILSFIQLS